MFDISEHGLHEIMAREGVKLRAYQDSKGIWTIGVGHTAAAGLPHPAPGMRITLQEALDLLHTDLEPIRECLAHYVKPDIQPELTQDMVDALYSFILNIGEHAFIGSSTLRQLNLGNFYVAADDILLFEKPPELKHRREEERLQFLGQ